MVVPPDFQIITKMLDEKPRGRFACSTVQFQRDGLPFHDWLKRINLYKKCLQVVGRRIEWELTVAIAHGRIDGTEPDYWRGDPAPRREAGAQNE